MVCKGICKRYQALKPIIGSRYGSGQKRCQTCEIFINVDTLYCPCCKTRLRAVPRNSKYKQRIRGVKIDTTAKLIYVGHGKNPKLELFIDQDYLKTVPRLTHEQFISLKESIADDGLHEPISVNENGKILDGHTRYQICSMLDVPVKYIVKKFKTNQDERRYVITTNLKRRQLNSFQQFELVEDLRRKMIFERNSEKSNKIWATRKGEKEPEPRTHHLTSTDKKLSEMTGIGMGQIEACVYIKAHGTQELIQQVRDGKITTNSARRLLLERDNKFYQSHIERKVDQTPDCNMCGAKCRKKRLCHVHDEWCCTKCRWGI